MDLSQLPVDTTYAEELNAAADDLEAQQDSTADFASEMYAVSGRIEAALANNHPPVAADDNTTTRSGVPKTIKPLANDTDVDGNTLTITTPTPTASHGPVSCTPSQCTYTPGSGFTGTDSFGYTISDGIATDTATVHITVSADAAPVAVDDTMTAKSGQALLVFVTANDSDPDHDPIIVTSAAPAASHGSVTCSDQTCVYTSVASFSGLDSFTYTISDGSLSASATAHVLVIANAPPQAADDQLSAHGPPAVVFPLSNDTDANDDHLTITSLSPSAPHGSVTCTSAQCTYTANLGFTGPDSFTYTVSDGAASASAVVHVAVTADQAPVARDDGVHVSPGFATNFFPTSNDFDLDNDTLFITTATPIAAHGAVTCQDFSCTYTANAGFIGEDSFVYTVSDGALFDSATVHVAVGIDGPPVANDDTFSIPQNAIVQFNVLNNDQDPENDSLSVTGNTSAAHGTATCNASGTCSYTPTFGFHGSDSFGYSVSDGSQTATGTVDITVGVNRAPKAIDDALSVRAGRATTIFPLNNDSDPDGDVMMITTSTPSASHGTATCDQFTCTYTPNAGYVGPDSFGYTISDGSLSASATVFLTIAGDTPPVALDDTAATHANTAVDILATTNDSDPDGDALAITSTNPTAAHGSVVCNGSTCQYIPSTGFFIRQLRLHDLRRSADC